MHLAGSPSIVDAWPMFRHNAERTGVGPDVSCDGFCDVPSGVYYSDAVDWMVAEGITTGISNLTPISRMYAPNATR